MGRGASLVEAGGLRGVRRDAPLAAVQRLARTCRMTMDASGEGWLAGGLLSAFGPCNGIN